MYLYARRLFLNTAIMCVHRADTNYLLNLTFQSLYSGNLTVWSGFMVFELCKAALPFTLQGYDVLTLLELVMEFSFLVMAIFACTLSYSYFQFLNLSKMSVFCFFQAWQYHTKIFFYNFPYFDSYFIIIAYYFADLQFIHDQLY